MDFRTRVDYAQTSWWERFLDVLARFDPTQNTPKARIQGNHQTRKGDTGRGRAPKPKSQEHELDS